MRSFDLNCRPVSASDVLCCSFSLQKVDCQLLRRGLLKDRFSIEEMANETGLERSTVQKSLSRLVKEGLANRFQENLKEGGYRFWYTIANREAISKTVSERVSQWSQSALSEVESWLKTNSKKSEKKR